MTLQGQLLLCSERASALFGDDVALRTYEDEGVSGVANVKPDLERLKQDVADGKVSCVITKSLDRLSRSIDAIEIVQTLLKQGIEFISIQE